jgi:uncharacterized Zn finger protein
MKKVKFVCSACKKTFEKEIVLQKARFNKAFGAPVIYMEECPHCGEVSQYEVPRDVFLDATS